ncbi:MAG TPA: ThiF family adenylyltransferase [Myxococcales bacterium]|nr:ThiF family adenylyltransferase [Myxococcales bacterium]
MGLKERQIQRYARQLLLPEIGGNGQQALLGAGAVALSAGGAADSVALAYLAAGGSPVRVPPGRAVSKEELGFLFDAEDIGKPAANWLKSALKDFNPDAAREPENMGLLVELPAQVIAPPPWVVMGWGEGGRGGIVYRTAEGCAGCFVHSLSAFTASQPSPAVAAASVALGALAALAFQRCTLGISEPLGGVWLEEGGALSALALSRCEQHA